MKIAFFSKELPSDKPNGVSCQVHRLANELSSKGHDVTCISFSPKPNDSLYNHILLSYNTKLKILKKIIPALKFKSVSSKNYDIVHYHGDDYLCRGNKKRIRTFYGSAFDEGLHAVTFKRKLYQYLFYIFEWISCFRQGVKCGISNATKKSLPLIDYIVPCGVPQNRYTPNNKKTSYPSLLFIGDFDSRKQGRMLLKIFKETVLPKYPSCILTVVGPVSCNEPNVNYVGNITENELILLYQQSWIYCSTSSYEGFGVPAIEAMACGTAVISTINIGMIEIIQNNYNGIISKNEEFGNNICNLISDENLRNKLIKNGIKTVNENFTISNIANKYISIYKRIL